LPSDLAFANVQTFLPLQAAPQSLRVLDIGSGRGATAVRLAKLGVHVTLLDSSPVMLDIAGRAARETGVGDRIVLKEGDASSAANLFSGEFFDIILCHNLLLPKACEPCQFLEACGGGCAGRRRLQGALLEPDFYCPVIRGERPSLPIRMAATRDLPKLNSSCTTIVIARE
jgi:SAM-dependent methyltransferase